MKKLLLPLSLVVVLAACGQSTEAPKTAAAPTPAPTKPVDQPATPPPPQAAAATYESRIDDVLKGAWRSDANKARDQYRHPKETLAFFGLKPAATVIEITPGGGWYTEVLAPLVKGQGKFVAAVADANTAEKEGTKKYLGTGNTKYREKLAADAANYGEVEVREFSLTAPKLGEPGTADVVLTFRNVHNFMQWKNDSLMFKAMFDVLKPGGVLGVTDHRAAAGADLAKVKDTGYLPEDYVIKLALDAGFTLEGRSEVNANPSDTKDYPEGVWTLPPSYALGDKDRAKYAAIGESDRMTLKFVKPAAK